MNWILDRIHEENKDDAVGPKATTAAAAKGFEHRRSIRAVAAPSLLQRSEEELADEELYRVGGSKKYIFVSINIAIIGLYLLHLDLFSRSCRVTPKSL